MLRGIQIRVILFFCGLLIVGCEVPPPREGVENEENKKKPVIELKSSKAIKIKEPPNGQEILRVPIRLSNRYEKDIVLTYSVEPVNAQQDVDYSAWFK